VGAFFSPDLPRNWEVTLKEEIRKKILTKREVYSDWEEDSLKVLKNLLTLSWLFDYNVFMLYYPHRREVDTKPIINHLLNLSKIVLLPKVKGPDILPIQIHDLENLYIGYGGIKEPRGNVYEGKIDVVIVPAVAFDIQGYRLGYGKGYYDRFLPKIEASY
jgi:5-formyltetrahydrofolate cyclo-ligase